MSPWVIGELNQFKRGAVFNGVNQVCCLYDEAPVRSSPPTLFRRH